MNTSKPDLQLVLAAREGDQDAYDEIFRRYRGLVRSKTRSYFLVGADRDDVIQEGNVGLCKAVWDYSPDKGASFHSFAELCVTRQVITAVKGATRKKHHPLNGYVSLSRTVDHNDEGDRVLSDVLTGDFLAFSAEDVCLAALSREAVFSGLAESLTPLEAGVLRLYRAGRTYDQIGLELNAPPKRVDNALQRAKRKMEALIRAN